VAVFAATLVGCSASDAESPLGAVTSTPGQDCFVSDRGAAVTRHVATFTPPDALELLELTVSGADNVEIIDSFVLPFTGDPHVTGTFLRYPPGEDFIADSLMVWSERQPLAGAGVEPADGQQAILVGVRLSDPSRDGSLDGFRLEYADGDGDEFTRDYPAPVILKSTTKPCTVEDFD
jgi:hypothetical protein